jgi:squalene-associated FAD-dependent desaturase
MKLAVVGAGWGGLAAAVAAAGAGHQVTVYEAARVLGGRARSLDVDLPGGGNTTLDNGQHIMIGAYVQTLTLMREVGVDPQQALLRLPLTLRFPDGDGLALPSWPAPWDAAAGILGARGWSWRDKFALLRAATGWQLARFSCAPHIPVAELCRGLTPRVNEELIDPLCVAALNTPAQRASGQVFLRVIRDALFGKGHGGWGGSNLLIPREALGRLFPEAAAAWLAQRGGRVLMGHRVHAMARAEAGWHVDGDPFDAVLLACPPWEAARLVESSGAPADDWLVRVHALGYEPIATVYTSGGPALPLPMLALRSSAEHPAQYVFDRAQLGGPDGLLAFVVSASQGDRETLQQQVLQQAAALGWNVQPVQTVVEKRATFACVPGLRRPPVSIAPGLWACGDYVEGPYPATIEGAVRSGLEVAQRLT